MEVPVVNQAKQIHEMCTQHSRLEQEIKDNREEIRSFRKRLDYILYMMVVICVETGISIPFMM